MTNEDDLHPIKPESPKSSFMSQVMLLLQKCISIIVMAWEKAKPSIVAIWQLLKALIIKLWSLGKVQYHKYRDKKSPLG